VAAAISLDPAIERTTERPATGTDGRAVSLVRVRLIRHQFRRRDGRTAGVAVAGWGVPLVVINGLGGEGILYAQTTSRLVSMGFKVIAVDTPGHGGSSALSPVGTTMAACAEFVATTMDELGVGSCLLFGHSMGGRVAAEVAASRPDQVAGVVLVDAILGRCWDNKARVMRLAPPLAAVMAVATGLDLFSGVDPLGDRQQAAVMARSLARTSLPQLRHPWQLFGPVLSILRAGSSDAVLEELRESNVTTVLVHGDRDHLVSLRAARDAQAVSGGTLVVVEGGGHLWLLQDPEVLPAVVGELLEAELGDAYTTAVRRAGLDPAAATVTDMETACYAPGAPVLGLTLPVRWEIARRSRRPPRHTWRTTRP